MQVKRIVANIAAENVAAARRFYQDILGLDLLMDLGWIATYGSSRKMSVQVSIMSEGGSGDLHPVQADGIRAVRRARTEDALLRPGGVPPWVHAQNVATSAIEPCNDDDLIARPDAPEALEHFGLEGQPGLGCAFVGLSGGRFEIGQRRLNPPDGLHVETRHVLLPISVRHRAARGQKVSTTGNS
jgi:Lactoylglutathione lyase and related lyases